MTLKAIGSIKTADSCYHVTFNCGSKLIYKRNPLGFETTGEPLYLIAETNDILIFVYGDPAKPMVNTNSGTLSKEDLDTLREPIKALLFPV